MVPVKGLSFVLIILFIGLSTNSVSSEEQCESATRIISRMEILDEKLDEIRSLLKSQETEQKKDENWVGSQATFGSFKRLSRDAKRKLISFKLTNTENLDVSTLIEELRPCTSLESIKLHQVELIGTFPNTSAGRVTLPKLHEFELLLDNYANTEGDKILSEVVFFQKSPDSPELTHESISSLMTDITIQFKGFTKFLIDHDFGELVLSFDNRNSEVLKGINPDVFSLKKLTVQRGNVNASQVPFDLSYLNLKYVSLEGQYNPTTEYMDILRKTNRLRNLIIDNTFDRDYAAVINLSELPVDLESISLRNMRVNMTRPLRLSRVESLLLSSCRTDNNVIEAIKDSFYNLKKLAVMFDYDELSYTQCHKLLSGLVQPSSVFPSRLNLRKLTRISIVNCQRSFVTAEFLPEGYEAVEELLTNLGLGSSFHFQLEKVVLNEDGSDWVWKGRNITDSEKKIIKYEYADWSKLIPFEQHILL